MDQTLLDYSKAEPRIRGLAKRQGLALKKSRFRAAQAFRGPYALIDPQRNVHVYPPAGTCGLGEIRDYLGRIAAEAASD